MKEIALPFCVAAAAIACSGSSSSEAPSDSGANAAHDSSTAGETSPSDSGGDASPPDSSVDSSTITDAPPADASDADGGDPLAPHPPADATKCGEGTFTGADAATACMKPSFALDDMLLPDGGTGSTPRDCSALTVSGGVWQVWCGPTSTYVWARFDDVRNVGTMTDCHGASLLMIDEGVYDTGSSGGNGAHVLTYQDPYGMIIGTPPGVSQTATYELTLDGKWPTGDGGASLFVLGSLEDSCSGGAPQPPTVLSGAGVTWKAP